MLQEAVNPEMFCKKHVLNIFIKFTGKHLCWGAFLIKFVKTKNFIKKNL